MLSSSRILELRRRATNVNSLTIRCPIPMFVVFSWGTILNLALVPVGSSLLSFQALIHELNSYATSTLMGDGAAGSGATKKKLMWPLCLTLEQSFLSCSSKSQAFTSQLKILRQ